MLNHDLTIRILKTASSYLIEELKIEESIIERLRNAYLGLEQNKLDSWLDTKSKQEIALPVENLDCKNYDEVEDIKQGLMNNRWAFEKIKGSKVIAFDTSEMFSHHITPYFILVNTGYFFYDYFHGEYLENSIPLFFTKKQIEDLIEETKLPSWILQYMRLDCYSQVFSELLEKQDLSGAYVFLDESISSGFLSSARDDVIKKLMNKLLQNLEEMINSNTIPIAIFYSMSRSFVNFLSKVSNLNDVKVTDKQLFDRILKPGQRSPLMKIYNHPTSLINREVYAFYLKIFDGNVLRVEFLGDLKGRIDEIHKIVLLQSIIGDGYPYCMARAHEQAYLSEQDRRFILSLLSNQLPGISPIMMSKKLERKLSSLI